jgi:hypothetical protein
MKPWEKHQQVAGPWNKHQPSPAPPEEPESAYLEETLSNVPGSAWQLAQDYAYPFMHPIDTATGLYDIGAGGVSKFIPGEQPSEAAFDAAVNYYGDRYGGAENIANTFKEDPVGVLSDLSPAGLLLGKAGKVAKIPGAQAVTDAATAIDPINLLINTPTKGISAMIPESKPASMYQEAAKINPTVKRTPAKIEEAVQTALDEQIMPTDAGMAKIRVIQGTLNDLIDSAIDTATDAGGRVDAQVLARHIGALRKDLGSATNIYAASDLAVIDKVLSDYGTYLNESGQRMMTPRDLQEFKKNTYKRINFDRSSGQADLPAEETMKAMARAAKEEVERLVPDEDIRALNAREGRLINLRDAIEKPASRIERRDSIGIGLPIKAATGGVVGGDVGAGLGLLHGIYDAPKNKARLALALHRMQQNPGLLTTSRLFTPARQGLLELGQVQQEYPSVFNR